MSRLNGEDKAGIYITVITHLTVIIILLLSQINAQLKKSESFVIDFSREDAIEEIERQREAEAEQEAFDELISRRVEEMIAGNSQTNFRNIAVNRSTLKDDRGTDAEKLYEDAEKLAEDLKNGFTPEDLEEDYVEMPKAKASEEIKESIEYSGPSVVSYNLEGRKASHLNIPAYRCYGGGMVVVIITVDNAGNVINAKVQDSGSSDDKCLRDYAIMAAKRSRFSSDPKAPARQVGDIVYQFIAQR